MALYTPEWTEMEKVDSTQLRCGVSGQSSHAAVRASISTSLEDSLASFIEAEDANDVGPSGCSYVCSQQNCLDTCPKRFTQ